METSLNKGLMASLFAIVAIDCIGMGIILPLLPFYSAQFGASPQIVGFLFGAFSLGQLIASPLLGRLSDRIGRKPVLMGSQFGGIVSFSLLACAPNLTFLFSARLRGGMASGNLSVASAYAIDASTPATRKQAIGIISSGVGTGLIIGPALSTFSSHWGMSAPLWIAALLSVCSMTLSGLLLPATPAKPTTPNQSKSSSVLSERGTLPILGILVLFYIAIGMSITGFAMFMSERYSWHGASFGPAQVGLVFTATGIVNILVQLVLMKPVGKRASDLKITIIGLCAMGLGYLLVAGTHSLSMLAIAVIFMTLGSSFVRPTLIAVLSTTVTPDKKGMIMGVNQSLMAAANLVAPIIGGGIIGLLGNSLWAITIVLLIAFTLLLVALVYKKRLWPAQCIENKSI